MKKTHSEHSATFALFRNESEIVRAFIDLKKESVRVIDIFSPYPVKISPDTNKPNISDIGKWAIISGVTGLILSLLLQIIIHSEYLIDVAQKPYFPLYSMVPVTYTVTILFAVAGIVIKFMTGTNLIPGQQPKIYNNRITNDMFCLVIDKSDKSELINKILKSHEAAEVFEDVYFEQKINLPIPLKQSNKTK